MGDIIWTRLRQVFLPPDERQFLSTPQRPIYCRRTPYYQDLNYNQVESPLTDEDVNIAFLASLGPSWQMFQQSMVEREAGAVSRRCSGVSNPDLRDGRDDAGPRKRKWEWLLTSMRNDVEEKDLKEDIVGRNCVDAGPAMMTTRFAYIASGDSDMMLWNV